MISSVSTYMSLFFPFFPQFLILNSATFSFAFMICDPICTRLLFSDTLPKFCFQFTPCNPFSLSILIPTFRVMQSPELFSCQTSLASTSSPIIRLLICFRQNSYKCYTMVDSFFLHPTSLQSLLQLLHHSALIMIFGCLIQMVTSFLNVQTVK